VQNSGNHGSMVFLLVFFIFDDCNFEILILAPYGLCTKLSKLARIAPLPVCVIKALLALPYVINTVIVLAAVF